MPKTPIDYSKSCIYKIVCKDTSITDCYIGSTTCMRRRKNSHKTICNNENDKGYNYKIYQFIRDNGGWDNWDMVLIEKVNVNDGYELHKEERKWIEELNSTLNSSIPTRTDKEYYNDNKEKIDEKKKEWRESNKERVKNKQKEYQKKNKESINNRNGKKVECPICNSIVRKDNFKKHQQSKKCLSIKNQV